MFQVGRGLSWCSDRILDDLVLRKNLAQISNKKATEAVELKEKKE